MKRKDEATPKPTEAELDILHVLWEYGASTVRFVNDAINKRNARPPHKSTDEIGYTTTLKIMQIMTDKKLVSRDESTRTHIYTAAVREEDVQQTMVEKFVQNVFRGSAMKLFMQALGSGEASNTDLDELKKLIEEKQREQASQAAATPSATKSKKG
jgi:predicted transcriptional regulator